MKPAILFLFILHFSLFTFHSSLSQQAPSWTAASGRNAMYPQSQYLVGFKSDVVDRENEVDGRLEDLVKLAKSQVVENIRVTIKSTAKLDIVNENTQTDESFKQVSTSFSEASLTGLKTDTYYDPKTQVAYAVAYVRISDQLAACKADLADKEKRVNQKLVTASQLAAAGELEAAITSYYDCFPILQEMENDMVLIVSLGKESVDQNTAELEGKVHQGISALRKDKQLTLDQACYFLADGLKQGIRMEDPEGFMGMGTFTYQDTRMGSEFSARLAVTLEQKLIRVGFNLKSMESVRSALKEDNIPVYLISGTYWDEADNIKVIAGIRRLQDGKLMAGMEEYLPKSWLANNTITYLPDNYAGANTRQQELQENEITDQGLQVNLWTNRGTENPLFRKGDSMLVYIEANRPCYIRLIHYLADGRKTLLVDNYLVSPENTNQPIRYPDSFICDAPYGSETLQVVAQNAPFPSLNTKEETGYLFITDDVKTILENVRGMKNPDQKILRSEKRIDITTVEK